MNRNVLRPIGVGLSAVTLASGCMAEASVVQQDAIRVGVEAYIDNYGCGVDELTYEQRDLNAANPNNFRPAQVFRDEQDIVIATNSQAPPESYEDIFENTPHILESIGAHEAAHACHALENTTSQEIIDRLPLILDENVSIIGVETGFSIIADINGEIDTLQPLEEAAASIIADHLYPDSNQLIHGSYAHTSNMLLSMMGFQNVTVEELAQYHQQGQPLEFIARLYGVAPEALQESDINFVLSQLSGAFNADLQRS